MSVETEIVFHDATIMKADLIGRPVVITLKDRNGIQHISCVNVEKVVVNRSENWGPSSQVLSLNQTKHEVTIQMQNGVVLRLLGSKPIEMKTQNAN